MKKIALILTILSLLFSEHYHLEYDNSSDFVQIDPYDLNGDFSISVDAALISGTRGTLFRQINGGEIHLGFENSKIRFGVKASTCSASYGWHNIYIDLTDLNIDQSFNNYTGVYSRYGQYLKLYVNDELVAFQSINSTNLASCNLYLPVIGFESDGLLKIKSFKIWNGIALSEENFINDINPSNNWIFDGQSQTILYDIVGNNHGTINGATWELNDLNPSLHSVPNEFSTIQEAIDFSIDGDSIFVFAGTYYENINFNGKNISLIGEDRETTIIDGNDIGRVVEIYNCLGSVLVSDFTIKNGNHPGGGGIYIYGSSPHLKNLIIRENYASIDGGGIHSHAAFPIMENLLITNNTSEQEGAGVYIENTFNDGEVIIKKSNIIGNISNTKGGGIYINSSNVSIYDSEIVYNYANNGAGGISTFGYSTNIYSCTIVKNQGNPNNSNYGAGIHFDNTNSFIGNSIIYLNDDALPALSTINSSVEISYSNIEHGWEGIGNINSNPQFTNSDNGDFTLKASSPCIDTGDPNLPLEPDGTRADIGAYYYHQNENSFLGCTDELACNYNIDANTHDDSCDYSCHNSGNYSLNFNGMDDYISLDPPFEGYNNNYSIALSFYANSYDGRMIYFNRNHDMSSYIRLTNNPANNNIELNFYVGTDAQNCPGHTTNSGYCALDLYYPVALNQWYDVVGTYNGQIMKLYVDGNLVNSIQVIGNQYWSGPPLDGQQGYWYTRIGDNNGGGYIPIDGKIDNIVIYDTALSENQILNLNTNLLNGNEQNIISLYKFNASNGNVLFDHSGNQNHGTIYGASWIDNSINQCCFESYGDINCDTIIDISDIIIMIDIILDLIEYSDDQIYCADVNGDSIVDISDLILLIDTILGF